MKIFTEKAFLKFREELIESVRKEAKEALKGEIKKLFGDDTRKNGLYYKRNSIYYPLQESSVLFETVRNVTEKLVKDWAVDRLDQKVAGEKFVDSIVERINKKQLEK